MGNATNQDTRLCCRVWSASQAVGMPGPRSRSHNSGSASWSPAHRSRSTDSMTTTPPIAHALQTPTDTRTKTTRGWGMRSAREDQSIATQARDFREWQKHEINESEHILSEETFRKLVTLSTKNIPLIENAHKMKRYLHVTVWKKMEVIGMDILAFGLMQICSLINDKEMNVVSLLLKILVSSVII